MAERHGSRSRVNDPIDAMSDLDRRFGGRAVVSASPIRAYRWSGGGDGGVIYARSATSWEACYRQVAQLLMAWPEPTEIIAAVGSGVEVWSARSDLHQVLTALAASESRALAVRDPGRIARSSDVAQRFLSEVDQLEATIVIGNRGYGPSMDPRLTHFPIRDLMHLFTASS